MTVSRLSPGYGKQCRGVSSCRSTRRACSSGPSRCVPWPLSVGADAVEMVKRQDYFDSRWGNPASTILRPRNWGQLMMRELEHSIEIRFQALLHQVAEDVRVASWRGVTLLRAGSLTRVSLALLPLGTRCWRT